MEKKPLRTREDILNELRRKGINISEYARRLGCDRMTVYQVLHSTKPCNFGKSHKAAVAMGIKDGEIVEE